MAPVAAHYPGQAPIEAYGNGGFRFAGMSHRGSLLIVPSGVYGWDVTRFSDITPDHLAPFFREMDAPGLILLGTGVGHEIPSKSLRDACDKAVLGLEAMSTGAACRTYNVLLAEKRIVGAGLIAVD